MLGPDDSERRAATPEEERRQRILAEELLKVVTSCAEDAERSRLHGAADLLRTLEGILRRPRPDPEG